MDTYAHPILTCGTADLATLMSRYRPLVRSAIAKVGGPIVRDSAEDIEQQVWIAIWRRLQGDQSIDHPTAYIYTVARREALHAVEDALARFRHTADAEAEAGSGARNCVLDPYSLAESRENGRQIRLALGALSPDRRRAVQAWLNGLDVAEVQNLFGWSYERTRNLIARGRADLRALLEPHHTRVNQRSTRRAA